MLVNTKEGDCRTAWEERAYLCKWHDPSWGLWRGPKSKFRRWKHTGEMLSVMWERKPAGFTHQLKENNAIPWLLNQYIQTFLWVMLKTSYRSHEATLKRVVIVTIGNDCRFVPGAVQVFLIYLCIESSPMREVRLPPFYSWSWVIKTLSNCKTRQYSISSKLMNNFV